MPYNDYLDGNPNMKVALIALAPIERWIQLTGVRILSACLKRAGHDVRIIFLSGAVLPDHILGDVAKLVEDSDLIGITLMTDDFENAVKVTKSLKNGLGIPIIWGGVHPTIRPDECIKHADIVCRGEGESALLELVRKMGNGEDFTDIQGMWFKHQGKVIKNKLRPLNKDLDSVPFQDYDMGNHYIFKDKKICKIERTMLKDLFTQPFDHPFYMLLSSRGCPFSCTYCWNYWHNKMFVDQPKLRKRSVDNVIEELVMRKEQFPFLKSFHFQDDAFFLRDEMEIKEFAEKYKEKVKMPFWIWGIHPSEVDGGKLSLLIASGMTVLRMGIQTGARRMLKLYKRCTPEQIEKAVKIMRGFKDKIEVYYDLILDNPWEKDEDTTESLMFLSKLPVPYKLNFFTLKLYPETDLYWKAKKEGIIKDDLTDVYRKPQQERRNIYLNKVHLLLASYVERGKRIPPIVMFLLTNRKLRNLYLSQLLYLLLSVPRIIRRFRDKDRLTIGTHLKSLFE